MTHSNGTGEGNASIEVDFFGGSRDAIFDPVGPEDVFFDPEVLITQGNFLTGLGDAADVGPSLVSQTAYEVVSTFQIN